MNIFVMKFGGDCLSTPKNQEKAKEIINSFEGKKIVICSAMGRDGFPYSTSNLNKICLDDYISNKERDRLLANGEIISSIRMSYILNQNKIKSYALSYLELGIICDDNYSNGNIIKLENNLNKYFDKYDVLLIPGFIGKTNNQEVITLGRGNADLTAVIYASICNIKKVYLYKNVEGVFHTSPDVYKKLNKYDYLSFEQMLLLNEIGFGIVSKKALIFAKENNIDIEIKCFENNSLGTLISNKEKDDIFLGFNIVDKIVKVASFQVINVSKIIKEELSKVHIFIKNEVINDNIYCFEINKSILSNVKKVLILVMNRVNKG